MNNKKVLDIQKAIRYNKGTNKEKRYKIHDTSI